MKKVLVISYMLKVAQGGSELVTKNLYDYYLKDNYDCLFLEIYGPLNEKHYFDNSDAKFDFVQKGVKYQILDLKKSLKNKEVLKFLEICFVFSKFKFFKLFRKFKINKIIKKFKPDIIYFVDLEGLKLVSKKYYSKSIVHIHVANKVEEFKKNISKYNNVKEIIVLTKEQKNMLSLPNVSIVSNSIDQVFFQERLVKSKNIAIVGRITEVKRFDRIQRIIEAASRNEVLKGVVFNIYGNINEEYANKIFLDFQCYESVVFHGVVNDKDLIYNNTDILLICSEVEGFSLVAVEAAMRGISIVSSNILEIRSVLDSIFAAVVNCSDDIDEYINYLEMFYLDDVMFDSQKKINEASKQYNHDHFVSLVKEVFERI